MRPSRKDRYRAERILMNRVLNYTDVTRQELQDLLADQSPEMLTGQYQVRATLVNLNRCFSSLTGRYLCIFDTRTRVYTVSDEAREFCDEFLLRSDGSYRHPISMKQMRDWDRSLRGME